MAFGGGKHQCPGRSVKQLEFIYSQTLQRTSLLNLASLTLGANVFALLFASLLMFSIIYPCLNWSKSGFIPGKDRWSHNEQAESETISVSRDIAPHPGKKFSLALPLLRFPFIKEELLHFQTHHLTDSYLGCLKPVLNKPTEHFSGLRLFPSSMIPLTSLLIFRYLNWLLSVWIWSLH